VQRSAALNLHNTTRGEQSSAMIAARVLRVAWGCTALLANTQMHGTEGNLRL
jgi:hypothetical protein